MTIHPNRGAVVAELSLDEILELMEIRIALECYALRLAVPQVSDLDLETAEGILRAYDAAPEPEIWGEMNWAFHVTLYAPCDRPKLLAMIEANYGHVSRFIRGLVSRTVGRERPQHEHYQLLGACRKGDVDRAVYLLGEHIENTRKSLMALTRRRSAGRAAAGL